jgi:hypothetical protein
MHMLQLHLVRESNLNLHFISEQVINARITSNSTK